MVSSPTNCLLVDGGDVSPCAIDESSPIFSVGMTIEEENVGGNIMSGINEEVLEQDTVEVLEGSCEDDATPVDESCIATTGDDSETPRLQMRSSCDVNISPCGTPRHLSKQVSTSDTPRMESSESINLCNLDNDEDMLENVERLQSGESTPYHAFDDDDHFEDVNLSEDEFSEIDCWAGGENANSNVGDEEVNINCAEEENVNSGHEKEMNRNSNNSSTGSNTSVLNNVGGEENNSAAKSTRSINSTKKVLPPTFRKNKTSSETYNTSNSSSKNSQTSRSVNSNCTNDSDLMLLNAVDKIFGENSSELDNSGSWNNSSNNNSNNSGNYEQQQWSPQEIADWKKSVALKKLQELEKWKKMEQWKKEEQNQNWNSSDQNQNWPNTNQNGNSSDSNNNWSSSSANDWSQTNSQTTSTSTKKGQLSPEAYMQIEKHAKTLIKAGKTKEEALKTALRTYKEKKWLEREMATHQNNPGQLDDSIWSGTNQWTPSQTKEWEAARQKHAKLKQLLLNGGQNGSNNSWKTTAVNNSSTNIVNSANNWSETIVQKLSSSALGNNISSSKNNILAQKIKLFSEASKNSSQNWDDWTPTTAGGSTSNENTPMNVDRRSTNLPNSSTPMSTRNINQNPFSNPSSLRSKMALSKNTSSSKNSSANSSSTLSDKAPEKTSNNKPRTVLQFIMQYSLSDECGEKIFMMKEEKEKIMTNFDKITALIKEEDPDHSKNFLEFVEKINNPDELEEEEEEEEDEPVEDVTVTYPEFCKKWKLNDAALYYFNQVPSEIRDELVTQFDSVLREDDDESFLDDLNKQLTPKQKEQKKAKKFSRKFISAIFKIVHKHGYDPEELEAWEDENGMVFDVSGLWVKEDHAPLVNIAEGENSTEQQKLYDPASTPPTSSKGKGSTHASSKGKGKQVAGGLLDQVRAHRMRQQQDQQNSTSTTANASSSAIPARAPALAPTAKSTNYFKHESEESCEAYCNSQEVRAEFSKKWSLPARSMEILDTLPARMRKYVIVNYLPHSNRPPAIPFVGYIRSLLNQFPECDVNIPSQHQYMKEIGVNGNGEPCAPAAEVFVGPLRTVDTAEVWQFIRRTFEGEQDQKKIAQIIVSLPPNQQNFLIRQWKPSGSDSSKRVQQFEDFVAQSQEIPSEKELHFFLESWGMMDIFQDFRQTCTIIQQRQIIDNWNPKDKPNKVAGMFRCFYKSRVEKEKMGGLPKGKGGKPGLKGSKGKDGSYPPAWSYNAPWSVNDGSGYWDDSSVMYYHDPSSYGAGGWSMQDYANPTGKGVAHAQVQQPASYVNPYAQGGGKSGSSTSKNNTGKSSNSSSKNNDDANSPRGERGDRSDRKRGRDSERNAYNLAPGREGREERRDERINRERTNRERTGSDRRENTSRGGEGGDYKRQRKY